MPPMKSYMSGELNAESIRKVKVEDLLGRDPVKLDRALVEGLLAGKRVMITGAGGSIGAEISRQVASFSPEKIIMVDFAESALFETDFELQEQFPEIESVANIVNVRNQDDLEKTFSENHPHCVFHAAAYKHAFPDGAASVQCRVHKCFGNSERCGGSGCPQGGKVRFDFHR